MPATAAACAQRRMRLRDAGRRRARGSRASRGSPVVLRLGALVVPPVHSHYAPVPPPRRLQTTFRWSGLRDPDGLIRIEIGAFHSISERRSPADSLIPARHPSREIQKLAVWQRCLLLLGQHGWKSAWKSEDLPTARTRFERSNGKQVFPQVSDMVALG